MPADSIPPDRPGELFVEVLGLDADAREAWLDVHCKDAGLRAEVLALCAADEAAGGVLDGKVDRLAGALIEPGAESGSAMLGARIGPWKITALLGEGGMATVWQGKRCDGQFEQQVAIKCLRTALLGPELVRRFERERQILASLEHPGMVRLLDGGVSADGVPYIVMQRVHGDPLIAACDQGDLGLRQRLTLFAVICDIVQFAHQHLVVHRDLKPANILLDTDGQPHLLDFGIAGLLDEAAAATTATRALALTPAYAAPEQRKGEPAGVAADVFALGVILQELVSGGERPDLGEDEDPSEHADQWPSRRVLLGAGRDASWRRHQSRRLRGDIDAIVLKCLRLKPEQRYQSVAHLAWDVRNHLSHRPVSARRGRFGYRAGLFVRRHAAGLSATSIVLLVLVASLAWSLHQTRRTRAALEESQAFQGYLLDLFESNLPAGAASTLPTTRELLERGARRARTGFGDKPALRSQMLAAVGGIYRRLGQYDEAGRLLREAVSTKDGQGATNLDTMRELALLNADQGHLREAAQMLARILAERRVQGAHGKNLATALRELGRVYSQLGEHDKAIALQGEAVDALQGLGDAAMSELADPRNDLGTALLRAGRVSGAIDVLRRALAEKRRVYGDVHEEVNNTASNLAAALRQEEQYEESGRLLREVVRTDQLIYTSAHPRAAQHLNNLGTLLDFSGRPLEAREYLRQAFEMYGKLFGPDHPQTAIALSNLAGVEYRLGHARVAAPMQRRVLKQFLATYGERHYSVAVAQNNLARTLADLGQWAEARELASASLKLKRDLRGANDRSTAPALVSLSQIDRRTGKLDAAREHLIRVLKLDGIERRADSPRVLGYRVELAQVMCLEGRTGEAMEILDAALGNAGLTPARAPLERAHALSVQGDCLDQQGQPLAARRAWKQALELRKNRLPDDFPDSRRLLTMLEAKSRAWRVPTGDYRDAARDGGPDAN